MPGFRVPKNRRERGKVELFFFYPREKRKEGEGGFFRRKRRLSALVSRGERKKGEKEFHTCTVIREGEGRSLSTARVSLFPSIRGGEEKNGGRLTQLGEKKRSPGRRHLPEVRKKKEGNESRGTAYHSAVT